LLIFPTTGKSSLTVRYVDGHFVESYYPTIENTFSKVIRYKGLDYATEIIDTAGQVRETAGAGHSMLTWRAVFRAKYRRPKY
jgi:small GTP-binding protein